MKGTSHLSDGQVRKEVCEVVLADDGPFVAISVARQKHPETVLEAKEVRVGKRSITR